MDFTIININYIWINKLNVPVGYPIIFARLWLSHVQLSLLLFVSFFDQTPKNAKTKGPLETVCTPTLKSV